MRLLRYGPKGQEKPGIIDRHGAIRDLSGVIRDLDGPNLSDGALAQLRSLDAESLPLVPGKQRIGPCVAGTGMFHAIGLNYRDHAAETGARVPTEPMLFTKSVYAICGPNDDVIRPRGSTKLDWEAELGIVIGTTGKYIAEANAFDHVAGYCVVNDVSEREFQKDREGQFVKGKSGDNFGPIGPWLVTRDEIPDPQNLRIWLEVDGERRQNGTLVGIQYRKVLGMGVVVADQGIENHRIQQTQYLWRTRSGHAADHVKALFQTRPTLVLVFQFRYHAKCLAEIFLMQPQALAICSLISVITLNQQK